MLHRMSDVTILRDLARSYRGRLKTVGGIGEGERMKILFIGGTGNISLDCVKLVAKRGAEVVLLNRGKTKVDLPAGVRVIQGDIHASDIGSAFGNERFDSVCQFIAFKPEEIERDIRLFEGRTDQYIFISSASAYQRPVRHYLITESTPLANPFWEYSRLKIACEDVLLRAHRDRGFPMTIVRPSYTYSERMVPAALGPGPLVVGRMRQGKPVIVHGDGLSLWTMTHTIDFAKGFVGLIGHPQSIGHAFHITSDEVLTWRQIYSAIAHAAGVRDPKFAYIPSETIYRHDPAIGAGLMGDKAWSVVFDNSKLRRLVPDYLATIPFHEGIKWSVDWFDAQSPKPAIDEARDRLMDELVAKYAT